MNIELKLRKLESKGTKKFAELGSAAVQLRHAESHGLQRPSSRWALWHSTILATRTSGHSRQTLRRKSSAQSRLKKNEHRCRPAMCTANRFDWSAAHFRFVRTSLSDVTCPNHDVANAIDRQSIVQNMCLEQMCRGGGHEFQGHSIAT